MAGTRAEACASYDHTIAAITEVLRIAENDLKGLRSIIEDTDADDEIFVPLQNDIDKHMALVDHMEGFLDDWISAKNFALDSYDQETD